MCNGIISDQLADMRLRLAERCTESAELVSSTQPPIIQAGRPDILPIHPQFAALRIAKCLIWTFGIALSADLSTPSSRFFVFFSVSILASCFFSVRRS
jgi:hypothetical protein